MLKHLSSFKNFDLNLAVGQFSYSTVRYLLHTGGAGAAPSTLAQDPAKKGAAPAQQHCLKYVIWLNTCPHRSATGQSEGGGGPAGGEGGAGGQDKPSLH